MPPRPPALPDPAAISAHPAPLPATARAIGALTLREMATRYGRNPGGYLWAVLEPVAGIAFLCVVFQAGFRAPPLGHSFALFYATGVLPFLAFTTTAMAVAQALNRSRPLLAYPRVSFLDALLANFLLAALTQLVVAAMILGGIVVFLAPEARIDPGPLALSYAMTLALGAGMGAALCGPITRAPLWQSIWSVATRPLILVSGVILLHDRLPAPWRGWLEWNPLTHVTGAARVGVYPGYDAPYLAPGYVFAVAGGVGLLGLLYLRVAHRDILDR